MFRKKQNFISASFQTPKIVKTIREEEKECTVYKHVVEDYKETTEQNSRFDEFSFEEELAFNKEIKQVNTKVL